jgi:hypothetical protein
VWLLGQCGVAVYTICQAVPLWIHSLQPLATGIIARAPSIDHRLLSINLNGGAAMAAPTGGAAAAPDDEDAAPEPLASGGGPAGTTKTAAARAAAAVALTALASLMMSQRRSSSSSPNSCKTAWALSSAETLLNDAAGARKPRVATIAAISSVQIKLYVKRTVSNSRFHK